MFIFENLLRNEYFPSELPPCFHSDIFANNHDSIMELVKNASMKPSDPLIFSGYKNTNSRRKFSVPNPYNYANAAYIISENSTDIFNVLEKSNHSLTVPLSSAPKFDECYKKPVKKISESKYEVSKMYPSSLCEVRLDIQSFFDNVYTHSIAWAIHSKSFAKKNKRDKLLLGNKLDICLSNLNSGQTNGILVGNAISRIASEIILSSVDRVIDSKYPKIKYLRYVDDYFIFLKDTSEINEIHSCFRQELAKYELNLNENKFQINKSPFIYGKPWVEQMRIYSRLKPHLLLEKAIFEYHVHNDIAILKYALKIIRNMYFSPKEWKKLEPVILNVWVTFPSLSSIITLILKNNQENVSVLLLKQSVYTIFDTHIVFNNDEEIIWAIWTCKVLNIKISLEYISKLLNTDNWLAIIIVLDIISSRKKEVSIAKLLNNFRINIIDEFFNEVDKSAGMLTEIWLLAYEADKNKWLNTSDTETFLCARKHPFFKELKKLDVDFYNENYSYDIINKHKSKSSLYITRKEMMDILKEYAKLQEEHSIEKINSPVVVNADEILFEMILDALVNEDDY